MIIEPFKYNLVVPKLSKSKRNLIVVGGFLGCIGIIVLVYFLTNIIIPILWFAIAYGLVLMALSGYLMQLKKIGTVSFNTTDIQLQNPELGMERTIETSDLKNIFIRKGLASNMVIGIRKKTLIVDLITLEDEPVSMQIEVKGKDIDTVDHLEKYFSYFGLSFKRKI